MILDFPDDTQAHPVVVNYVIEHLRDSDDRVRSLF